MSKKLSILIPTVFGREDSLNGLLSIILNDTFKLKCLDSVLYFGYTTTIYSNDDVDVIILKDAKKVTIGEKREFLYKIAEGLFSFQVDDDDSISENAIELILAAIKSNPEIDCITFREKCLMNGEYKSSNHSIKYSKWQDNFDGYDYVRSPFYKDVIRTDLARLVPFHKVRWNEDELFSKDIYPHLKSEIHLEEEIYIYIYEPKDSHEERYGFNKQ